MSLAPEPSLTGRRTQSNCLMFLLFQYCLLSYLCYWIIPSWISPPLIQLLYSVSGLLCSYCSPSYLSSADTAPFHISPDLLLQPLTFQVHLLHLSSPSCPVFLPCLIFPPQLSNPDLSLLLLLLQAASSLLHLLHPVLSFPLSYPPIHCAPSLT